MKGQVVCCMKLRNGFHDHNDNVRHDQEDDEAVEGSLDRTSAISMIEEVEYLPFDFVVHSSQFTGKLLLSYLWNLGCSASHSKINCYEMENVYSSLCACIEPGRQFTDDERKITPAATSATNSPSRKSDENSSPSSSACTSSSATSRWLSDD